MVKSDFVKRLEPISDESTHRRIFMEMYEFSTNVQGYGYESDVYVNGEDGEFSDEDLQFIKDNYDNFSSADRSRLFKTSKGILGTDIGFLPTVIYYGLNKRKASDLFIDIFLKLFSGNVERVTATQKEARGIIDFLRTNEDRVYRTYDIQEFSYDKFDEKLMENFNIFIGGLNSVDHLETPLRAAARTDLENLPYTLGGVEIAKEWDKKPEGDPLIPPEFFKTKSSFRTPIVIRAGEETIKPEPFEPTFSSTRFSELKASNNQLDQDYTLWPDNDTTVQFEIYSYYLSFFLDFIRQTNIVGNKFVFDSQQIQGSFNQFARQFMLDVKIDFTANSWSYSSNIVRYIATKMIDRYRKKVWSNLAKFIKDNNLTPDDPSKVDKEKLSQSAFQGAAKAAEDLDDIQVDPEAKKDEELTEAEIKEKQKFLKQCVLMTQLEELRKEHLASILDSKVNPNPIHTKGSAFLPYKGRFYMVRENTSDQSSTINKLLIPNEQSISQFLNISPAVAAHLVPKLRFYKVFTDNEGKLDEFEFEFRNFTESSRVNSLASTHFDRGGDYGVKSFDFSFDGSTPATAKNDIKADLKLYFQSFGDFIKKRRFGDYEHSFVDLLLLPGGQPKSGSGKESDFQYQPSYYRIRVDVGWMIDPVSMPSVKDIIGAQGVQDLAKALELINKSFYLNMIDHTMDFRDDGSVDISVNYRAYVESALKGTSLDALADKRTQKSLAAARRDYEEIVSKQICNVQELNRIRRSLSQLEELLRKQSLQSITKRLTDRLMIRTKIADKSAVDTFAKTGFLDRRVKLIDGIASRPSDDYLQINYFYLADLLYVILDSIYDERGENYIEGTENFKFVLTSFEYSDVFSNNGTPPPINIGSIPITMDIFSEWFKENVLKAERTNYPIMYFIRDLAKYLLVEIMSETCFKSTFDKSLNFKTANFLGKRNASGVDAMASLYPPLNKTTNSEDLVIDVTSNYNKGHLPLRAEGASVFDLHNYIVVYAETPRHTASGKVGDPVEDGKNGIIHYRIGQDKGIVKKIKFSKSDMQYIREARFFRHGNDGLMQLSAVYKVSLDMIGNTLYYPGMEVYIDPVGFLGANQDADPRIINSVANKLGFGGYHLVTSVKSSIAPGKFTTTVEALFHYSGDGQPSSILIGKGKDAKKVSEMKKINEKPESTGIASQKCIEVNNKVVSQLGNIAYNGKEEYENVVAKPPPATTTTAQQATSPQPTVVAYIESSVDQQGNPQPGLYAYMSDGTKKWFGPIGTPPPAIP